jgi:hypothetical protein
MHHALGNTLVVEVEDFLTEMEIIHDKRPARADPQRILVVGNRPALGGRQHRRVCFGRLVQLSARTALAASRRGSWRCRLRLS